MYQEFEGPYFSTDLFGPNGRLTRLHKGGKPPKPIPTPPPVRESSRDVAAAGAAERADAINRKGYTATTAPKKNKSLLASADTYAPGSRSLL